MREHRQKNQPLASSIANLLLFFGSLTVMGVLSVTLPKPTVSEVEKRELAEMPAFTMDAYFDGSFAQKTDAHYSDTFPFRDFFVTLGSTLGDWRGFRVDDVKIHEAPVAPSASQPAPLPEPGGPSQPPAVGENTTSSAPGSQPEETAVGEQNGSVFIYKGKGMPIFGANVKMGEWYASVLNNYAAALPEVQVYNLIIPSAIEFGLPEKYKDVSMPQKPVIDHIYSFESDAIKQVDAYSEIEKHKEEYLYFGTDHHWTVKGAYYAYVAFCKEAGFTPTPYDSFEWNTKDNFLGTLYAQTNDASLRENPDHVDYPTISVPHKAYMYQRNAPYYPIQTTVMAEYASGVNKYSVFLHGDQPMMEIQTENKNGRKIVVVKESFGNAFAPFLINHYETVYVVDQRYFQLGLVNFIQEHGVTDLLFINNIFAANTPVHIRWIEGLMYQQFVPPPPPTVEESGSEDTQPPEEEPLPEGVEPSEDVLAQEEDGEEASEEEYDE